MYGAEQPRKRVCSSRTMVMKRCEDSDSAGLVSTLLTTASGHVSSRAQRTAVTVVTAVLSSHGPKLEGASLHSHGPHTHGARVHDGSTTRRSPCTHRLARV